MNPKFLRNKKTGVRFPYHPLLAKNKDMKPDGGPIEESEIIEIGGGSIDEDKIEAGLESVPVSDTETDTSATAAPAKSENGIIIDKATKKDLLAFAKEEFGVTLEDSLKVGELRKEVKALVAKEAE